MTSSPLTSPRTHESRMNVSQAEYQNMKEEIVKDMIARLMEERGLTMQAAFDAVYTSRLFEKLSDPKTGLYFQSSGYVYSFLTDELDTLQQSDSENNAHCI